MQTLLRQEFRHRVFIPRLLKEPTLGSHLSKEFASTGLKLLCIGTDTASNPPLSMAPTPNDHEGRNRGEHIVHAAFTSSNNMSM